MLGLRKLLRSVTIKLLGLFRKIKPGVYILNGHYLSRLDSSNPEIFKRFLLKLQRSGVCFINIEDAVEIIDSGGADKQTKTFVAFTFDDGFDDCYYSLAPVLRDFNVNACFFVNPNYVVGNEDYITNFNENQVLTNGKRPMSWLQIKELHNEGFIIGNHTLDHYNLSELPIDDLVLQVSKSKEIIETELAISCDYFAWPYGQFKDITDEAIEYISSEHRYIFSGCDYKNYKSFGNRVFNRRHFESSWHYLDLKYFLTHRRNYS